MMKKRTVLFVLLSFAVCCLVETPTTGQSGQSGQTGQTGQTGQFNLGFSYNGYYNDNIFMNATQVADYLSALQTDLNLTLNKFNLYLSASADLYADNPGYNSFYIEPGVELLYPLKGRNNIYLGVGYSILNYKELYTDFNYSGPIIQAGIKLNTSPRTLLKAGFRFQSRNYTDYESFDYIDSSTLVEFKTLFKTQTTVRLQTGFNYRYYPHIVDDYDFEEGYNYFQNQASHGKGKGKPGNPPNQQNQHNQSYTYHSLAIPSFYGIIGIDQGLSTRLGISGEAEYRQHFRDLDYGSAETLIKNAYILYPLNDDYLWKGTRLTLRLNVVLFRQLAISLEGKVSYFDKQYPGIYVMDAEGNPSQPLREREDSLLHYMLKASKTIGKLELLSEFTYRHNKSNDNYFFYDLLTISVGIGYYL